MRLGWAVPAGTAGPQSQGSRCPWAWAWAWGGSPSPIFLLLPRLGLTYDPRFSQPGYLGLGRSPPPGHKPQPHPPTPIPPTPSPSLSWLPCGRELAPDGPDPAPGPTLGRCLQGEGTLPPLPHTWVCPNLPVAEGLPLRCFLPQECHRPIDDPPREAVVKLLGGPECRWLLRPLRGLRGHCAGAACVSTCRTGGTLICFPPQYSCPVALKFLFN